MVNTVMKSMKESVTEIEVDMDIIVIVVAAVAAVAVIVADVVGVVDVVDVITMNLKSHN